MDPDSNPLLTDLDFRDKKAKKISKAQLWFEKDIFKNLENEDDADYEMERMIDVYKKKGGHIVGEDKKVEENMDDKKERKRNISETDISGSDDTNSDYDVEEMMAAKRQKVQQIDKKNGFEIVSKETGEERFCFGRNKNVRYFCSVLKNYL